MRDGSRTFWHWPTWRNLGFAMALGLAQTALFVVVYGGTDWIARQHGHRIRVHLDADLAIPLVPGMAIVYLSLMPLLWMAPFVLRSRRELVAFVLSLAVATVVAGAFFLLAPAVEAFEPPGVDSLGFFAPVYRLARMLALKHNYLPSLHAAFTTICILIYCRSARDVGKLALAAWGAGIVASTLLTRQHYMLDVVSGMALGWASVSFVYLPRLRRSPPAVFETHPANRSTHPERSV